MNNQLEKKNQDTMKKVFKLIRPYMHYLILSLIFAAISVALTLYAPILSGNAIDLILSKGHVDFAGVFQIFRNNGSVQDDVYAGTFRIGSHLEILRRNGTLGGQRQKAHLAVGLQNSGLQIGKVEITRCPALC